MALNALTKEEKDLLKICTDQAKYFLSNAGEFFPFGLGLDQKKEFHPIGVYLENEHPSTLEVLNVLTQGIAKGIAEKKYLLAGICTGVSVNRVINNVSNKLDAIEVKIVKSLSEEHVLYVPYEITSDKIVSFGEVFTME